MSMELWFLVIWSGVNMGLAWTCLTLCRSHAILLTIISKEPRLRTYLTRLVEEHHADN